MRAINLLPRDEKRRTGPTIPTAVAFTVLAGLILVTAVLGLLVVSAHGKVKSRQLELIVLDICPGPRRAARLQHRGLHVLARRGGPAPEPARGRPRSRAGPARHERAHRPRLAVDHPLPDRGQRQAAGSELVSKKKTLPQSAQIAIVLAGLLVVAAAGYFLAVKPQKSKAADLAAQISAKEGQISDARALLAKAKHAQKVKVADLFRLTKAMPDQPDEAGIVLELTSVARSAGIPFESITPQGSTVLSGYQVVPITVVFDGNFFQLNDFLFRLRNLVDVRQGELAAGGRLFTIDSMQCDERQLKFPMIRATLQIDAFIYGAGSTVSAPPQTSTPATTGAAATTPT